MSHIWYRKDLPYPYQVALGIGDNFALPLEKFGYNPNIGGTLEDVWTNGGDYTPPTQARAHTFVSSSLSDTMQIQIQGLDENYELVDHIVTLTGQTPVVDTTLFTMIHRMYTLGAVNVGDVTATAATDGTVTAIMPAGEGQTLMAVFQVPAGYTLLLDHYYADILGITAAQTLDAKLKTMAPGAGWRTRHWRGAISTGAGSVHFDYQTPLVLTEKTFIKIRCVTSTVNARVSGGFGGLLVKNTH